MAKTEDTPVKFIETTTEKLSIVQGDPKNAGAFIHVNDTNGDDTLYIGDDLVTDRFNIKSGVNDPYAANPSDPTIQVGNFKPENYGQLQGMTVSQILREMFRPISISGVSLNKSSHTLRVGGTVTLSATVTPSNATDVTISWESEDGTVASVNGSGEVTANKVGQTEIKVTANPGNKFATCVITVEPTPPTVSTYNSVSISYSGPTLIGTDENLPDVGDITSTIVDGVWSDGTPYAGGHDEIVLSMNPSNWNQPAEEGTYTISGKVNFYEGQTPKDNAGNDHPTHYTGGEVTVQTPITIDVLTPIYINDVDITSVTERHLVDYRNQVDIFVTIPKEIDGTLDKFQVYLPYPFSKFKVYQYNTMTREYDREINMVLMENEESKYIRTTDVSDTLGSTDYKITLKKQ